MKKTTDNVNIWWFKDGKPGHEKQSLGLINALQKLQPCDVYEFSCQSKPSVHLWLLKGIFPPANKLSMPNLIIGAGHTCHLFMLAAKRATTAKTIVLMRPSLPLFLFDLCLIPEHDRPAAKANVITTKGAINCQTPTENKLKNTGLILIGGPSKHYHWQTSSCIKKIKAILKTQPKIHWHICDSRRTTTETSAALKQLNYENAEYVGFEKCQTDWLENKLATSEYAWVSEDSVSMIYESISAGCKTGVINLLKKRENKISLAVENLTKEEMILEFDQWQQGKSLNLPKHMLHESLRTAQIIHKRFLQNASL